MCFVDTMRPVTPAETTAWRLCLSLHRDHWRAARKAFRRVCAGTSPAEAIIVFVGESGVSDPVAVVEMERALVDLAAEAVAEAGR